MLKNCPVLLKRIINNIPLLKNKVKTKERITTEISPNNLIETLSEIINDLNHNQWNRLLGEIPENWEDDYNYIAIKYKIFDNISKLLNDPFEMLCYYTHCKYIAKAPFSKRELQYYLLDGIYDECNYQSSLSVVSKLKEWIKKRYNRIKVNKSK